MGGAKELPLTVLAERGLSVIHAIYLLFNICSSVMFRSMFYSRRDYKARKAKGRCSNFQV
jgi:hypothetical protein